MCCDVPFSKWRLQVRKFLQEMREAIKANTFPDSWLKKCHLDPSSANGPVLALPINVNLETSSFLAVQVILQRVFKDYVVHVVNGARQGRSDKQLHNHVHHLRVSWSMDANGNISTLSFNQWPAAGLGATVLERLFSISRPSTLCSLPSTLGERCAGGVWHTFGWSIRTPWFAFGQFVPVLHTKSPEGASNS